MNHISPHSRDKEDPYPKFLICIICDTENKIDKDHISYCSKCGIKYEVVRIESTGDYSLRVLE